MEQSASDLAAARISKRENANTRNKLLIKAATSGNFTSVNWLLHESGINPAADNNAAIKSAAARGHAKIVNLLLLDGRADPTAGNSIVIRDAAKRGHVEIVDLLLRDGRADPTAVDNYAIRKAAQNGHVDVVELLLTHVHPPKSMIVQVSRNGRTKIVELLLQDGRADPSGNAVIGWAIWGGHHKIVELLLQDSRVDLDVNYAISMAISCGHVGIIKMLFADPRVAPNALTLAVHFRQERIVRMLLQQDSVETKIPTHHSAWLEALKNGSTMLAQMIFDAGFVAHAYPMCYRYLRMINTNKVHPNI